MTMPFDPTKPPQTGGFFNATAAPTNAKTGATTFSAQPGQNLLATQFNPQASKRTTGAQTLADQGAQTFANYQGQYPQTSPGYTAVQGPQYTQAMGQYGQAGQQGQIATPQYTQSRAALQTAKAGGQPGMYTPQQASASTSGQSNQLRAMTLEDLQKARTGPDRAAIAASTYDTLTERGRPEFEQRVRGLGQNTAALGRIGSGQYGSNLVDLNAERERELSLSRSELANNAAAQTLDDRLKIASQTQGAASDVWNQDLGASAQSLQATGMNNQAAGDQWDRSFAASKDQFGRQTTLADMYAGLDDAGYQNSARERDSAFDRNMGLGDRYAGLEDSQFSARRGERDTAYGVGRDQYGDAVARDNTGYERSRDQFTTLADYAGQLGNEDRTDRAEMRSERDYQYGLNRDATDDARWDYSAARDADRDQFDRTSSVGFQGNPTAAYQNASQGYSNSGQQAVAGGGDLLGDFMYRQSGRRRRGATGGAEAVPPEMGY